MNHNQEQSNIDNIRHSLAHLLAMAVLKKFPKAKLGIGPTIENGFYYDFKLPKPIGPEDLKEFETEMKQLIAEKFDFKGEKITVLKAKRLFKDQPFKLDLIKEFSKEKKQLTLYHTGKFTDLCRGGHVKNTSEINPNGLKLTKIAGAYWRGNEKNPQLTRIYGVAFNNQKELEHYLWQEEEAKKRDHRILGERLKLFTFAPEVGPGLPLWLPNGTVLREMIEERAKKVESARGYKRVTTPHIAKEELFKLSGHIPYYQESMYPPMKLDDGNYYLKPMNCAFTHMIYKAEPHSYRELPIRYAEYGTVYRHELSGTLAGLLRTRGFTQNDAHIYCREDQVVEEFLKVMKLHEYWYKEIFGINDFYMRLSLPSKDKKKFVNIPASWTKATQLIREAMKQSGLKFSEAEGEAAFYGPKVDFQIKSVIGREETASTNQLDFLAAERFKLTYTDKDGKNKPVWVIHRSPLGSHERFIAFLIEHYAGDFPFWLAPIQIAVLAVTDKSRDYAIETSRQLKKQSFRITVDARNETIGKKIREAELQKIPYLLIIGEKEQASGTVAVRERGAGDKGQIKINDFIESCKKLLR